MTTRAQCSGCVLLLHLGIGIVLAAISASATAHDGRPVYVEIRETLPRDYDLRWKVPSSVPAFSTVRVVLPDECSERSQLAEFKAADGLVYQIAYHCPQGLAGRAVAIHYLGPNPSVPCLMRYLSASREEHVAVLESGDAFWSIPEQETFVSVSRQYALLGIGHIWSGSDHLLFLVCLLWIARTGRRVLTTVTGFTVAHSVTLILSQLQIMSLPSLPVEVSIALSILFLAIEIIKGERRNVTWRYPILVSTSFGLLHGFGFAAALTEIGLPQRQVVTGLLFFNIGVEIGQLLFVAGAIALMRMRLLQRIDPQCRAGVCRATMPQVLTGYLVGTAAIYWMVERSQAFLGASIGLDPLSWTDNT